MRKMKQNIFTEKLARLFLVQAGVILPSEIGIPNPVKGWNTPGEIMGDPKFWKRYKLGDTKK